MSILGYHILSTGEVTGLIKIGGNVKSWRSSGSTRTSAVKF